MLFLLSKRKEKKIFAACGWSAAALYNIVNGQIEVPRAILSSVSSDVWPDCQYERTFPTSESHWPFLHSAPVVGWVKKGFRSFPHDKTAPLWLWPHPTKFRLSCFSWWHALVRLRAVCHQELPSQPPPLLVTTSQPPRNARAIWTTNPCYWILTATLCVPLSLALHGERAQGRKEEYKRRRRKALVVRTSLPFS